jgi:threonine/homoserine/homoserine lactone efflux protein
MKILLIIALLFLIVWALFATFVAIVGNTYSRKIQEKFEDIVINSLFGMVMIIFIMFLIQSIILFL